MNCPACSAPVAGDATWCPTCGGALPSAARPPIPVPVDPAASAANRALALSLPAPCCAPLAVVGAFYAIRSIRLSGERRVPRRALFALALGAVSLLVWGSLAVSYVSFQRQDRQARRALQGRLAGKREAATVDRQVACDLVEEQLRAGLYERRHPQKVACHGPLETGPGWALLRGVEMDLRTEQIRVNACLARAQRWFVVRVTAGQRCPPPPSPRPGLAPEVEEDTLRREAAHQADQEDVAAFVAGLARAREALQAGPRITRVCPRVDVAAVRGAGHQQLRLHTVDYELLDEGAEATSGTAWEFLTSSDVKVAIEPGASMAFRAPRCGRSSARADPTWPRTWRTSVPGRSCGTRAWLPGAGSTDGWW